MNTFGKLLIGGGAAYLVYKSGILSSLIPSAGTSSPAQTPATPAATGFSSLSGTYARLVKAARDAFNAGNHNNGLNVDSAGVVSATFSAWNYFLGQQTAFTDLPAYQDLSGLPDPNIPMDSASYWALISPWLTKNKGMSGLGFYQRGNPILLVPENPFRPSPANATGWY